MSMTSRERVRAAVAHKDADRIPRDFSATDSMMNRMLKAYGFSDPEQLRVKFGSDMRLVAPTFTARTLERYTDTDGLLVEETMFGYKQKYYPTPLDYCPMNLTYPWDFAGKADDIKSIDWLHGDDFDYESIKKQIDRFPDKAIGIGGPGIYQYATFMRTAERLYMDMVCNPDIAHAVFDKFVDWELEYYERQFIAGDGQIDYLLCCDDYGTQTSLLFSVPMWRAFFMENTRRMAALAHKYGAFYMQHSCGAIRPLIGELIACGVDVLGPIQNVDGMEPAGLKKDFGKDICFHGAIDTQWLLPGATTEKVADETRFYMDILGKDGGYIVGSSQDLQIDIPMENVEAMYNAIDSY